MLKQLFARLGLLAAVQIYYLFVNNKTITSIYLCNGRCACLFLLFYIIFVCLFSCIFNFVIGIDIRKYDNKKKIRNIKASSTIFFYLFATFVKENILLSNIFLFLNQRSKEIQQSPIYNKITLLYLREHNIISIVNHFYFYLFLHHNTL